MKSNLHFHSRKMVALAFGTIFAAGLFSVSARADQWDKKTIFTVNQPVQVRDTLLQPGQYVFRLLTSGTGSERHVVQIFNADESHIINTILAVPAERVNPTGNTAFTFWETPPGSAKALRKWFYPGDNMGQEFPYPDHLQQLAVVTPPAPEPVPVAVAPAPQPEPTPQPEQTPQPETMEPQPQPQPEPQQDQTPPPAPTPAQPDNSADRAAPTELPKTASPYPLIGLCGLALAGFAGILRIRRTA